MRSGALLILLAIAAPVLAHEPEAHEAPAPAAVLAPGWGPIQFEPPEPGSYVLPSLGEAADGEVLDDTGRAQSLHELYDGRVVLLSFVYSSCADVNACPLSTAVLHGVKARCEADPALAEQTRILSLSFDPERDKPAVMREYGGSARGGRTDWRFLTTASLRELGPILEDYEQPIAREYDEAGVPTGQFTHVLRVFLIDKQKRIRNVYSSSFLHADLLVNDIRTLLLEGEAADGDVDAAAERDADAPSSYGSAPAGAARPLDLKALADRPPLGLSAVPVPGDNPLTREKIALGRKLFFDRRLSLNNTISCAMCHIPDQGFTHHETATAVGIEGRTVRRNSPTLYNVAYAERLFHDGRETRLEQQVWGPLLARNEMGNPAVGTVIEKIESIEDYDGLFEAAFGGRGPGMESLGAALASYERTLLAANSPFDRWRFAGKKDAIDASAERGFRLFSGKAGCVTCHPVGAESALFTDHGMHNTGVGYGRAMAKRPAKRRVLVAPGEYAELDDEVFSSVAEPPPADLGRYEITQDPDDRWRYKTPSLRNVALTAPYMHDGSLATLRGVVEFYNAGGVPNETLDPLIRPLGLDDREIDDLVAFLESLTGDSVGAIVLDARAAPIGDPE